MTAYRIFDKLQLGPSEDTHCTFMSSELPLIRHEKIWCMLRAKHGNPAGQKHYRAGLHSQIAPADVSSEREQLTKGKQSIDAFVRTLQHKSSAANAAEGRRRGIVYPAGGTKQVPLHKELCDRHLILLTMEDLLWNA